MQKFCQGSVIQMVTLLEFTDWMTNNLAFTRSNSGSDLIFSCCTLAPFAKTFVFTLNDRHLFVQSNPFYVLAFFEKKNYVLT